MLSLDHPVTDLVFSPAGDLAIASGPHVWLAPASGGTVRLSAGNKDDGVECVAFRDARTLTIACKESGIRIVELAGKPRVTKPRLTTIATTCYWHTMLWSPDGKYIVGQYEPWVSVIDVDARSELRVLDPDEFDDSGRTAMVFAGATLYTTAYNKLVRWRWADVLANKAKCRMPKTGVTGHAHLIDLVQLADGSLMALADVESHERYLQRFAPTGERMGKKIEVPSRTVRIASIGEQLVLVPYDGAPGICTLDGTIERELEVDVGDLSAIAVHGDKVAFGGATGVATLSLR